MAENIVTRLRAVRKELESEDRDAEDYDIRNYLDLLEEAANGLEALQAIHARLSDMDLRSIEKAVDGYEEDLDFIREWLRATKKLL